MSALRGFSAPVILQSDTTDAEFAVLAMHDPDPFARWEAVQHLASAEILKRRHYRGRRHAVLIIDVWRQLLADPGLSPDYRARALRLVPIKQMLLKMQPINLKP